MPKKISRTPVTPRNIRNIRPKRQLPRNSEKKQDNDDDWWNKTRANKNGGEEQSVRGVAAVHRLRRASLDGNSRWTLGHIPEESDDSRRHRIFVILRRIFAILKCIIGIFKSIFAILMKIYRKIRESPRKKRRKMGLGVLIMMTAWQTIYLVDLDQYSFVGMESRPSNKGSMDDLFSPTKGFGAKGSMGLRSMAGINDEFSSLKGPTAKRSIGNEFSSLDDDGFGGSSSMFGKQKPKMDFSSSSMTSGLGGSRMSGGSSGSMAGFGGSRMSAGSMGSRTSGLGSSGMSAGSVGSRTGLGGSGMSGGPVGSMGTGLSDSGMPGSITGFGGSGMSGGLMGSSVLGGSSMSGGSMDSRTSGLGNAGMSRGSAGSMTGFGSSGMSGGSMGSMTSGLGGSGMSGGSAGSMTGFGGSGMSGGSAGSMTSGLGGSGMSGGSAGSMTSGLGGSGMSGGSMGGIVQNNMHDQRPAGMKPVNQISYSDSMLSPPLQGSNTMTESMRLEGNGYVGSGRNNLQSDGFSNAYPLDKKMGAKSPQLPGANQIQGGNQQQMLPSYQDQSKESHMLPEYASGKGLRGQSPQWNSQSVLGDGKYQQSIDNFQSVSRMGNDINFGMNDLNINQDTAFGSNIKQPASPLGGIKNGQFPGNQNNLIGGQNKGHGSVTRPLDCAAYGGPYLESEYAEIVYWRDIQSDGLFTSPFYNPKTQEATSRRFWKAKYLTFEMDDSGWNNMRLGFENVMLLAHSMGRTLVLPPKRQIAHGMYDSSGSKVVSFADFYDIEAINAKQKGLNIITMETFLEREALNGNLKSKSDGRATYPPNNQIAWDNQRLDPLWRYIREVTKTFSWNPKQCVVTFPAVGTDEQHLFNMMADVLVGKDGRQFPHYSEYQGRPINVDAPPIERFREILAGRKKICMYDRKMHEDNSVVHFKADQMDGTRLITQFYAFLWFEDWRQDLWSKRFVRDSLRYNDEIMCLSARIIGALRTHARQHSPGNVSGAYDAVHIRRGDFQQQFPMTEMSATDILTGLQEHIPPGSTIFICTNERDMSFFRPIQQVYDVLFLGDFGGMLSHINPNYFPLVEQIVASRSRLFFGTFFSTFSAYVTRLRGYYSVLEKQEGYRTGSLRNSYFLPTKWKKEMHLYQAIHKPLYGRDFPVAWRDIDRLDLPG